MKRIVAFLLVLAMAFSLAVLAAAEEPAEPVAKAQLITEAVFADQIGFSCDQYGFLGQYHNKTRPISVFGEPLTTWDAVWRKMLNDDLFALQRGEYYALFYRTGKQLTGFQYTDFREIDGYIRGEKSVRNYDFFTATGKMMPKPIVPEGYVVDRYLKDDLIVAGYPSSTDSFGNRDYRWKLFRTDGTCLSPEWDSYVGIERLTEDLLKVWDSSYISNRVMNEQGELLTPAAGDHIFTFEDGSFLTMHPLPVNPDLGYQNVRYVLYDSAAKQLGEYVGTNAYSIHDRYLAIYDESTRSLKLLDHGKPISIPAGAMSSGSGEISKYNTEAGFSSTPLFYIMTKDQYYTVYDLECNVVIPEMYCRRMTIAANHVLAVNYDGDTELYNVKGEKVATLPGSDYQGFSEGLLWHKQGNAYAIYNLKGEQVTDYTYSYCGESGAFGLVNVKRNGKYFLINAAGEEQNSQGFDAWVRFESHFGDYQIAGNYGIVRYLEPGEGLFWDVKEGDWFCDEVYYCYENDILNGTGVGRFQPDGVTTRAMVVTVLYRLAGSPEVEGELPFTDVEAGQWYSDAVLWANQNEIVNGVGGDRFAPTANITREQIATILYRYSKFTGIEMAEGADLTTFPDSGKVADFALEGMAWAVAEGLITGTVSGGTTTLSPQASATRAQLATIISRYQQMFPADSE